ncbi:putative toxin-antitoxin system, antitoxin component [Campylobacter iguaniorum]|uniref:HicB family protein n=1 Tax=Campylobacter iguaniorum TaxID=1244531 RepID=UPI00073A3958|nr:HicB family protein [Campylobacter iguaniorum]ALV24397.1 putative protein (UPF0150 domain) [Campylobacter iguaniorum]ALV24564.1 putative toxin-antitoxin system, antitoxin component [Campylobacter iguaniorum]
MQDLEYYLNLPYKIEITKISDSEGGGYCATMPDFKGVALFYGDGETKKKALDELDLAFRLTLETLIKDKSYIPLPASADTKVRINITLPKSLIESIDKITKNRSQFLAESANLRLSSL